jgi:tripartite ATP-independent transporter DctP family solute receptor
MIATTRKFRRIALAVLCAVILPFAASGQQKHVVRVSTPAPAADILYKSFDEFRKTLEAGAPGTFDLQVFASNSLFRQGQEVLAMQKGNLDMHTTDLSDISKQLPELSIFTTAYLIRDYAHMKAIFDGPVGADYAKRVSEGMGIEILAVTYLGTRQLWLRQERQIRVPADLAGLKLRMPGLPEWLFLGRALGATPTPVASSEVYLAMKTGTVDAAEFPLSLGYANKLNEVTAQVTLTGHVVQPVFFTMSRQAWAKLSPPQQELFRKAAQAAAAYNDRERLADEKSVLEALGKQGIKVTTPDVAAFREHVLTVYKNSDVAKTWPAGMLERISQAH